MDFCLSSKDAITLCYTAIKNTLMSSHCAESFIILRLYREAGLAGPVIPALLFIFLVLPWECSGSIYVKNSHTYTKSLQINYNSAEQLWGQAVCWLQALTILGYWGISLRVLSHHSGIFNLLFTADWWLGWARTALASIIPWVSPESPSRTNHWTSCEKERRNMLTDTAQTPYVVLLLHNHSQWS